MKQKLVCTEPSIVAVFGQLEITLQDKVTRGQRTAWFNTKDQAESDKALLSLIASWNIVDIEGTPLPQPGPEFEPKLLDSLDVAVDGWLTWGVTQLLNERQRLPFKSGSESPVKP